MVAMNQVIELGHRIAQEFDPERIILFGSYANKTATEHSDVDLLVIMPFEGKPLQQSLEILNKVNPSFPVDLLARRPDDTHRRYAEYDPLIRDALDHGVVLYERNG